MTWFVESPWPAILLGVALEGLLAAVLFRTRRGAVAAAMGLVLALTVAMVILERAIVTPREEVEGTLHGIASSLAANDATAVLASFSPACPRLGEVRSNLSHFTIQAAKIGGDLEVQVDDVTSPPSATTVFTGRVEAKDNRGQVPYEHMIRKFKVTLQKQGGRWLISDFADSDFRNPRGR